jgi:hypothetical protein
VAGNRIGTANRLTSDDLTDRTVEHFGVVPDYSAFVDAMTLLGSEATGLLERYDNGELPACAQAELDRIMLALDGLAAGYPDFNEMYVEQFVQPTDGAA